MTEAPRLLRIDAHDDGTNRWSMRRIAPSAALAGLIGSYTDYEERTGDFTVRRELPHGAGVLIINLGAPISITAGDGRLTAVGTGEAFVAGFHLNPALSHSGGEQCGIQLEISLPALRRLLGIPMDQLLDRVIPLDALLGSAAGAIGIRLATEPCWQDRIKMLETELLARFARRPMLAASQLAALGMLRDGDRDIMEVARTIGWSRKHLADRVRDAVGVGPRSYRRVLRFEAAIGLIQNSVHDRGWAGLATEAGYCDQSHLIREFRELAGMTPTALVRQQAPGGGGFVEA